MLPGLSCATDYHNKRVNGITKSWCIQRPLRTLCYTRLKWQFVAGRRKWMNEWMNGKRWICFPRQDAIWGTSFFAFASEASSVRRKLIHEQFGCGKYESRLFVGTVMVWTGEQMTAALPSTPPPPSSIPPSLHPFLPPSLATWSQRAMTPEGGREWWWRDKGLERGREWGGGPQRVRWRRGGRKGEKGRGKRWDKEINNTFILMISWSIITCSYSTFLNSGAVNHYVEKCK